MPAIDRSRRNKRQHIRRRSLIKQRRAEWFASNGPCKQCGSTFDLQVDHVVPIHSTGITRKYLGSQKFWAWPLSRLLPELAKCQVLCISCHRKKTVLDLRRYTHGLSLYQRHGCRCPVCRAASADKKRRYRQKLSDLKTTGDYKTPF